MAFSFGQPTGALASRQWGARMAALACIAPVLQAVPRVQTTAAGARAAATLETNHEAYELVQWIRAGGGRCEGLHIAAQEAMGQTLVASQAINKGQLLVAVPRSRQLSADSADPALQGLIDKVPPDLWAARLALPLLAERAKGAASAFKPYLHTLPAGIQGLPLFFQPQDIRQLQYPPLVQQVSLRCRWLLAFAREELGAKAAAAFSGVAVDANLLGWALGTASSRAFRLGGKGQLPSLLPLIDLCNHSFAPNCALQRQADGTAELVSVQRIAADEPLTISYGRLSNTQLLQDYGFIVEGNAHDTVQLALSAGHLQVAQTLAGIAMPDDPAPWQAEILAELGCEASRPLPVALSRGEPRLDWRLVAAARVLSAGSRGEVAGRGLRRLGDLGQPLARPVETKALRTLAAVCAQMLAAMGSTAQEDRELLAGGQLSADGRLAVRYRLQLKEVAGDALGAVLDRTKALQQQQ